ncbi:hypothetical protein [Bacillus pinisoli]|uniref:hypothetical protein n=1 Tax=Bacillus pinisoli TaxID=2901866 RepID=UPI001FF6BE8A|nr:hypothetical protein [Bacillus pinisoli]
MNTFNQIWMECWLEKGYMLDPSLEEADRFIIIDSSDRSIGTIEFKPYTTSEMNEINKVFPFHKIDSIYNNQDKVIEIDKVAILKEFRGRNLERLLSLFIYYNELYQIEYNVVLLERVFYRALKNVYKLPLETVGEQFYYKGDHVIPTVVYPGFVYMNKEKFPWLLPDLEKTIINT